MKTYRAYNAKGQEIRVTVPGADEEAGRKHEFVSDPNVDPKAERCDICDGPKDAAIHAGGR